LKSSAKKLHNKQIDAKQSVLVGRQPIYDDKLQVYAYELLYRASEIQNCVPRSFDGNAATSEVMLNTFLEIGLENIVGLKPAFINLTEDFLVGGLPCPLPPNSVVLEILENIKPTPKVLSGLVELKECGFKLALDDFIFEDDYMPFVEYADFIKVDVNQLSQTELVENINKISRPSLNLIAEKVETLEQFEICKLLGFHFFQGYFLAKPVIVKGHKMPANKLAVLQLLNSLQDPSVDIDELLELIKIDASLSYKILRYINSPSYSLDTEVNSIRQALILLGLDTLKRWVTLIVLSGISDKSSELILIALFRAKMCELLSLAIKETNNEDYFLVGLFSTLDAMLDQSMEDILHSLPLQDHLKNALLTGKGKTGRILGCVKAYEKGDWQNLHCGSISINTLRNTYMESIAWADQTVHGLSA